MRREDELSRLIRIFLINNRELIFSLEDRDADELVLILKGYAWNILEFFFFLNINSALCSIVVFLL